MKDRTLVNDAAVVKGLLIWVSVVLAGLIFWFEIYRLVRWALPW